MVVVMSSRSRMGLDHTIFQRRSESRVGWFRADASVIRRNLAALSVAGQPASSGN